MLSSIAQRLKRNELANMREITPSRSQRVSQPSQPSIRNGKFSRSASSQQRCAGGSIVTMSRSNATCAMREPRGGGGYMSTARASEIGTIDLGSFRVCLLNSTRWLLQTRGDVASTSRRPRWRPEERWERREGGACIAARGVTPFGGRLWLDLSAGVGTFATWDRGGASRSDTGRRTAVSCSRGLSVSVGQGGDLRRDG